MTYKLFGHDVSASKTMKDVGKVSAGVAGGIGASWAASKIGDFAKSSMQQFESLGQTTLKLQRYMGGSAEDASRLAHAFTMTGVDSDTASKGLGILSKHLAANDKAAKSLGISFQDSSGKVKPMNELLPQIAEKFKNMPAGAEKSALAMKLFGKNGMAMLPFLNKGSAGIQELMKESDALGTTLTGKDLDAVKEYTKAKRQWSEAIKGVQVSLGKNLYPVLTSLATKLLPLLLPKLQQLATHFGDIGPIIDKNWPQIESTLNNVGKALERSGKWIGFLWEQFNKLPAPVKELIAMLAIAQKTGALSIAFKGLDLAKNLLSKVTGMSVQAGIVKVNGPSTPTPDKGSPGGPLSKAGWATAIAGFLGSPVLVAALVAAVAGTALTYYVSNRKTPGQTVDETPGSPGQITFGGTFNGGGGITSPGWSDRDIARQVALQVKLAKVVRDTTKSHFERIRALMKLRDMGTREIQSLKDQGASTEKVNAKTEQWRQTLYAQAKSLGWSDQQIEKYTRRLGSVPKQVHTSITAEVINDAVGTATGWITTLTGIPTNVKTELTANKVEDSMRAVTDWVSTLTGIPTTKTTRLLADTATAVTDVANFITGIPTSKTVNIVSQTASAATAIANLINSLPANLNTTVGVAMQTAGDIAAALRQAIPATMNTTVNVSNTAAALATAVSYWTGIRNRIPSRHDTAAYLNAGPAANEAVKLANWISAKIPSQRTQSAYMNAGPAANEAVKLANWIGAKLRSHTIPIYANIGPAANSALALADKIKQVFGSSARSASISSVAAMTVSPSSSAVSMARTGTTVVNVNVTGSVFGNKEQMARTVVAALQDARNRGLQLDLAR